MNETKHSPENPSGREAAGAEPATYRLGKWILDEDWPLWLLLAACAVVGALIYPSLPDRIPVHWNIRGEVDGWGSRGMGVFGVLGIGVSVYLLLLVLPLIDPRRENYPKFRGVYRVIRTMLVGFFAVIWALALAAARGVAIRMDVIIPAMISCLFIVLGNLMGRIRYNWFVGIRTPWSLSNEEAWRRTHRTCGRVWVLGGIIGLLGALWGGPTAAWALGLSIGGATVFSIVYSYFAWRQTTRPK
jgi:uncharacterized membrane protein